MKQFLFTLLFCILFQFSYAQFPSHNVTMHSLFALATTAAGEATPSGFYNDCWGYSADGREYAIFGSLESIHFVDITNPAVPVEVEQFIEVATPATGGTFSLWRDFKVYGHYAYAVVDLNTTPQDEEGLLIFDLSDMPNSVTKVNTITEHFSEAHNIFVDEPNGRLYACGSDTQSNGVHVFDVATDPSNPILLSAVDLAPLNYVHDLYVADNIVYASHGNTSTYGIWNFEDPTAPFLVASVNTGAYQHSSWPTEDNNYAYYCEETQNTPIGVIDISDVDYNNTLGNDIFIENTFREPLLEPLTGDTANIAHNPFIKDNLLYISYYEDGLQVFDVSDPTVKQPPRVAYFDTSPLTAQYTTTLNNWGTYPFFDSGIIIATDTELGLFILELDAIPLAVELYEFTAQADKNKVRLEWASLSELNHAEYVVERSLDIESDQWETIDEVASKGNSPEGIYYTTWDDTPQKGVNYYRLAMKGTDYKTSHSDIISVEFLPQDVAVNIHPTLVSHENIITIELEEVTVPKISVELIDINGKIIQRASLQSSDGQLFDLELEHLPKGVYILNIKGHQIDMSQRIVKS